MAEKAMGAAERINAEMQKTPDDRYAEIIGQYVIDRCGASGAGDRVAGNKTLKGAMEAVRALAAKRKQGNVAVLTPGEVFGEVDRYFGFETDTGAQWRAVGLSPAAAAPERERERRGGMSLDLDELW